MQNSVWLDCPKCPWIVMSLQYLWKQYSYWKKRQSPSLTRQFMGKTSSALLDNVSKVAICNHFFIILYLKCISINFSLYFWFICCNKHSWIPQNLLFLICSKRMFFWNSKSTKNAHNLWGNFLCSIEYVR